MKRKKEKSELQRETKNADRPRSRKTHCSSAKPMPDEQELNHEGRQKETQERGTENAQQQRELKEN